jgi:hypothetical protein
MVEKMIMEAMEQSRKALEAICKWTETRQQHHFHFGPQKQIGRKINNLLLWPECEIRTQIYEMPMLDSPTRISLKSLREKV